jgi:hypothetical protein
MKRGITRFCMPLLGLGLILGLNTFAPSAQLQVNQQNYYVSKLGKSPSTRTTPSAARGLKGGIRPNIAGVTLVEPPLAPPPPTNVQVNQLDSNSTTLDNDTTENEPSMAASGSTVVVGWNDSKQFAASGWGGVTSITGYGFSVNGGASFTDAGQLSPPSGLVHLGDPALAVDGSDFYFASLAVSSVFSLAGSRVAVAKSTSINPNVTFGTPVTIPGLLTTGSPFQDKELIAADGGRVYVTWTEFASMSDQTPRVVFARSTSTTSLAFAAPIGLSPPDALNQGAMPVVAANGAVYVVWGRFVLSSGSITSESIRIVKSTDHGMTFANPDSLDPSPSKIVASPTPTPGNVNSGGIAIRTRDFPYIAADRTAPGSPTRGNLYVVFQADPDGAGPDRSDIFFTRSTNGGKSWDSPRSISGGPAVTIGGDTTTNDNFMPSISVSPTNGQITVLFYDRRNDTTSADGDPPNTRIAVFKAVSSDAGLTWFDEQVSTVASRPATGYDPAFAPSIGDYIYNVADGSNFHYTWTDFRNPCSPPGGAIAPCSPSGRSDQDIFYANETALSGPDLAITPWGYTTGIGPLWQTPDIFCVDGSGNPINAAKGVLNQLRAHVRNLGNAAAPGAIIRFRYAPIFTGLADSAFKLIGTAPVNFAAAGSGGDNIIVPISWDLTNTADDNSGQWPNPISAFNHFCVRVSVELPADVNMANNDAQNNFFDVEDGEMMTPLQFMVGNPSKSSANAELILDLPKGVRGKIRGFARETGQVVVLKPREIRVASVVLTPIEDFKKYPPKKDVVANINFRLNGRLIGGISARLFRARTRAQEDQALRDDLLLRDAPIKDVSSGQDEKRPQEDRPAERQRPPEETRGVSQTVPASFDRVFGAILTVLEQNKEPVALANRDRGLINTRSIPVSNKRLREIVAKEVLDYIRDQDGRYLLSFVLQKSGDQTKVTVSPMIIVNMPVENPLGGQPVASNGTIEKQHLDAVVKLLR